MGTFQRIQLGILKHKVIFLALLFLQNIAIFWQHYYNNWIGFTLDFKAYYAFVAFWTTSISMGIFPQWIPYQSMGYPLAINSQSGLYYPIFWIFALLHIPYTLHDAVIVQVLHVFFGSIGMFLLLNLIFKSSRYAFIGAVAFQFFGGFYSNAMHSDIIRAFAIAPWLFYVFKISIDDPNLTRRILFIPIPIYFLATGGYPGNLLSSLFIIPVFLCLEIFHGYLKVKRRAFKVGAAMFGLMVIGISMSAVHLGPLWQERSELTRFTSQTAENKFHAGLGIEDAPALYMSSRLISGQPNMISTFVTLPMLIFASFIPISALKKHWVFVAVLILSVLMVGGPNSLFWRSISSAVPELGVSRWPSSDYRVFIAIPLILLGTAGLRAIIECKLSQKELLLRVAFVSTWFLTGVYFLYSNAFVVGGSQVFANLQVTAAVFIFSATISFIIYHIKKNKMRQSVSPVIKATILSSSALIIIVLIISADGFRVISDMAFLWTQPNMSLFYQSNNNGPLEKNGKLITFSILENIPTERPPRQAVGSIPMQDLSHQYSWRGYLHGSYMMEDYSNTILNARSIVESDGIYRNYMLMKWTPLLVEPSLIGKPSSATITLPVSMFSNIHLIQANSNSSSEITQTRYGINDISYKVMLKEPKLMVENEIYFPGWHADLIFPNKETKLPASVVNNVFRAWLLPAGDYAMIAHFSFPNLIIYQCITIVSFGVWIFIAVRYWRRPEDYSKQPLKERNQ